MIEFYFNKKRRLITPNDFNYVFKSPNVIRCKEITILGRLNLLSFSRLGISVSRKNVKYAYQRNKIKRLIRENFRIIQHRLVSSDFVVIVNSSSMQISFKLLAKKLENLWSYYYQ
ncbi:ribonuclease P protein component [Buchnera aphidicola str. Bp (Baizongia pistaciae)]|uniref:Ribonuclease P protein component n=1 Tax=Buchnera aphidicola subsp. Baizongia pistaciae (strain Bp) TaxID=224915 RepID=RNPA_BUCBP|nr:ribonuclease P protein component [Buchnera aphidicola]P59413.1 RecName: Full=Ribonuclease P protein component; Short=RNase P protein; Short=RNaseP protein; AltName: Full=Protein C5 [Buchnera aphidicola str. Bp (Baizongia pistaciae)]AAO26758.1 ribonuclease P protein component [Buchnera aphidicola str. Bp (Baizongia pistaciae)]